MSSSQGPSVSSHSPGLKFWVLYFNAIATGPLLTKPHRARRLAQEGARNCPYPDIAAAGLAKVKAAIHEKASQAP